MSDQSIRLLYQPKVHSQIHANTEDTTDDMFR
jgi:hypothetical protein